MTERILVTGAAGFAGGHLLDRLAPTSAELFAWRHRQRPPARFGDGRIRWADVDVLDRDQVRAAVSEARPTAVVHCAGAAHVGRSWDATEPTLAANVRGTHHLLEALRALSVPVRVVIPSSAMVYRPIDRPLTEDDALLPSSPYGVSKLAQEMLGRRAVNDGLSVVVARAFNHVGPGQSPSFAASSFARQIAEIEAARRPPVIVVGNLEARRDISDVRDTVRAYHVLLTAGGAGRCYNICAGRAISIRELLDRLIAKARVTVDVRVDPALYRPNDTPLVVGDPSRAERELGWSVAIPIEETVGDLLDYWRHVVARN